MLAPSHSRLCTICSRASEPGPPFVERRPGIFYVAGRAFLHFHEDAAGLFADLRLDSDWQRFPVNNPDERAELLAAIDRTRPR
jgi:hypothetical protein